MEENNVIYLNSFVEDRIRRIETGAELMLCIALNAYTKKYMNRRLDCGSVRVNKELMTQELYAYACDPMLQPDGVIFHPDDKPYRVQAYNNRYNTTDIMDELVIDTSNPNEWVFGIMNDVAQNTKIRIGQTRYNYVYIVAKWMVYCLMNKTRLPVLPKLIFDHQGYSLMNDEYAALIILQKYGNKLLANNCEIRYPATNGEDPEWVAYCEEKRERGLMSTIAHSYSIKQKMEYLLKGLKMTKGDVVILYRRRAMKNSGDVTKNLVAAYPAVITGIDKNHLTLTYFTQTDLLLTRKHHLDMLKANGAGSIYTQKDYIRFDKMPKSFEWQNIGIEGYSTIESWLIIPPVEDDSTIQWLNNGEADVRVELNTLETIYALFEDRGVAYDKERFLKRYFGERIPIYEQFKRRREAIQASRNG